MSDDCFAVMGIDDGVVGVVEFVEFFRCWKCFSIEDVFVGDVEVRSEVVFNVIDAFFGFAFVGCVVCLWNSVLVGFEYGFRVWTEFDGFGVSVGGVLCVGFVEVIGEVDGAFVECVVFECFDVSVECFAVDLIVEV